MRIWGGGSDGTLRYVSGNAGESQLCIAGRITIEIIQNFYSLNASPIPDVAAEINNTKATGPTKNESTAASGCE